jgi:glycosyltransferase involved in cell wall biosynthesis
MHLVINATEVGRQRGGNESCVAGLIQGLSEIRPSAQVSLLICDWGMPLSLPAAFHLVNLGSYRRFAFFLWQQTVVLRTLKADWYLANFFLPPLTTCRGAIVVHDLSFRAHPEYFPRGIAWYMRWLTWLAIQRARCVFTDSEFSKQELVRFYPTARWKAVIMPMGVGTAFCPLVGAADAESEKERLSRYGVTMPYILALGNIHPRKNLARLLDAYVGLCRDRGGPLSFPQGHGRARGGAGVPTMVWAGLPRWGNEALLQRARAVGVALTGFVSQEDLPTLYRHAEMLVYPSLYEGFGLPPLEAMACGTPVIASNATSVPEVTGDAALLVDPTNTDDLKAAMARLLDDKALTARLRQAGIERARTFTWARSAECLLAALSD